MRACEGGVRAQEVEENLKTTAQELQGQMRVSERCARCACRREVSVREVCVRGVACV